MEFLTKGREVKPLILKLSIVIAFSFTGFFLSQFRSWRALKEESQDKNDEDLEKINKGKSKSKSASSSAKNSSITSINNTTEPSATKDCQLNNNALSLPDRNHKHVSKILLGQNTQSTTKDKDVISVDEQILQLTNMIVSLQAREKSLEQQLSEYQGMQEQENVIRELESKLKICKVEGKIYNMRIETLKIDNQRLQAYEEDTKMKIKTLKKKLKEVEEENGILAGLHRKVSILHEDKLRKLIDQENKATTLQKKNSELLCENSELLKKLELALQKSSEVQEALKEIECLKLTKEELSKDIEILKSNNLKDNEELVYLRWVNACLRYELKNFNPSSGKSAKDLGNSLSQDSKEKAKSLILEYASSISETDQDSCLSDDTCATSKTATPTSATGKRKNQSKGPEFFNKFAKFMLRKKSLDHETIDGSTEMRRVSASSASLEEILSSRGSYTKSSSSGSNTDTIAEEEVDVNDAIKRKKTEVSTEQEVDVIDAIKKKKVDGLKAQRRALECEKADLRSFANQLNRSKALQSYCKKSTSFST